MYNESTVVILQNSEEEAQAIAENLSKHFKVLIATDNYLKALEVINSSNVNFFVTALMLKQTDGISVIKQVKQNSFFTSCIVLSVVENGDLVSEVLSVGADYYMIKPINYETLIERMKSFKKTAVKPSNLTNTSNTPQLQTQAKGEQTKNKIVLDEKISRIFIGIGIPPHIKGYGYLREGVKLAVDKPELINCVTKKLYPMIGERFATTPSKVERAIRHAIEVAWNKGRIEAFNSLFGVRAYSENEKPTNSEFIALIADRLLLDNVSEVGNDKNKANKQ